VGWFIVTLATGWLLFAIAGGPRASQISDLKTQTSMDQGFKNQVVIEFGWPTAAKSETLSLILSSLDDATTLSTVAIEPLPGNAKAVVPQLWHHSRAVFERPSVTESQIQFVSWSSSKQQPAVLEFRSNENSPQRCFFVQTAAQAHRQESFQPVMARLAAESERIRVWNGEAGRDAIPQATVVWLMERMEAEILPKLQELYGEIADIDGDGKLSICLTDRLADLPANGSPVEGLVQANDFHVDLPRPFSNQADVMFLSRSLTPGPQASAVLAHEAAHLAVFSRRREVDPQGFQLEDDWLNEGFAHLAEVRCGGSWTNLQARITAFRADPSHAPLIVVDAQAQGFWRDPGSRGAAWAFLNWLSDEYGSQVISELAASSAVGCGKIEAVLQEPFVDIFRRWTVSRASSGELLYENGVVAQDRSEFQLRGTAHCATLLSKGRGWRVTAPANSQLQVTLVDPTSQPVRCWIVR